MERRFISEKRGRAKIETRADGTKELVGLGAVFYDGTEATEYRLWGNVKERIMPGAFDRAIEEKHDVRGLVNHNPNNLLGRTAAGTMAIEKTTEGLAYRIELPDTQVARDTAISVDRGDLSGSSFSFSITSETWRQEGDWEIRELNDLDMYDTGPVTYPAYEGTSVGVRDAGDVKDARESYDKWKETRNTGGDSEDETPASGTESSGDAPDPEANAEADADLAARLNDIQTTARLKEIEADD